MTKKFYALANHYNTVLHEHLIIKRVDGVSCKNLGYLHPQAPNF